MVTGYRWVLRVLLSPFVNKHLDDEYPAVPSGTYWIGLYYTHARSHVGDCANPLGTGGTRYLKRTRPSGGVSTQSISPAEFRPIDLFLGAL